MLTKFKIRPSILSFKEIQNFNFPYPEETSFNIKLLIHVESFQYFVIRRLSLLLYTSVTISISQSSFLGFYTAKMFDCQLLNSKGASNA